MKVKIMIIVLIAIIFVIGVLNSMPAIANAAG
jgi:hypothetical protein